MSQPAEPAGHGHRLLVALARHRRFSAAATLFSTSLRTTRALNSLLAALCSSSSAFLRAAPAVLLRAAPHAAPDASTFSILTSALCRARQPAAAVDLLRCMPGLLLDPEPHHCRAVLASLCQRAPARDAAAFLDDMRRWGVSPDASDHRAVMDAFLREGKTAEAYDVVANRMDADGATPGVPEFERVMRAFRATGDLDAVDDAFDEMLLRGLVPCARVHSVRLGALCDAGDLAAARRTVDRMERAGCPPDVATFGVLVAGCVAAGDAEAAAEAVREAARRGLRWDAPALSELVGALRAGGHLARARALLLEIVRDGCSAGTDASALRRTLIECGALCEDEGDGPCADADELETQVKVKA